jgi:2-aminoethylphosphonate-pyruvate transaminase
MIEDAVILAAGLGSRLGNLAAGRPKGFVEIGGMSLVERSIKKLFAAGIKRVVIGTGYRADCYQSLAAQDHRIVCRQNADFATTGSMSTLLAVAKAVQGDFFLLESDILYADHGLSALAAAAGDNVILASDATDSGDEVFIEMTADGRLADMSKQRAALRSADAELVGITRLSRAALPTLCAVAVSLLQKHPRLDYETCLVAARAELDVRVHRIPGYPWCEVDTAEHLQRAVSLILPRILKDEIHASP